MKNYQELAQVTSAPVTPELMDRLTKMSLLRLLSNKLFTVVKEGSMLNIIKGHAFYGKKDESGLFPASIETHIAATKISDPKHAKIIHGILGLITESCELGENLLNWLFNSGTTQLDIVNIAEELGDIEWFSAEVRTALGVTQDQIQEMNITKLKKRYAGKYSDFEANNRDLVRERAALEGKEEAHDQAVS